ncbi:salicylate hydroxylase [Rhizobium petrolearium]|uniref:FAD-dependent monooxygenase n=1 Tax=Neorhizobium petrolearium TaxID=515361 RepID=UPI001AE45539|nr:FAD-dependent monooxygenase [Neorhizobium petrolearium]MBP1845716.1 salicylate hydroxylase [Neorhizobium petrolearium]
MADRAKVIIGGAGIGGLIAALALIERGFEVEIHEQAPELKEIGAGLQLAANSTRLIIDVGLGRELADISWEPQGKEIRLWSTGRVWTLFDLAQESVDRFGAPYYMVHRADLHQMLVDAVNKRAPGAIRLSSRIIDFTEDDRGVHVVNADGRRFSGDLLIGADGVHSAVRGKIFGAAKPEYTGLMVWRGIIPTKKLPEHLLRQVGTNWVGPNRHVIQYMVRRGELMNFVGVVERGDWTVESWTAAGSHAECHADFEGWHEDVHTMIENIEVPYKWALIGRAPMQAWSEGRTTLLGDACHPTLPFLAQGAGMAIEDGVVLARCLDAFWPDYETALLRYEALRLERTSRVVTGSLENGRRFHNPEMANKETAEAYVTREWRGDRVNARYNWLFEYDASSVPLNEKSVAEIS